MPLSSELKSTNKKQTRRDYTHHSNRRERFREEARRDLVARLGTRDEFGRREIPPTQKKRWFFSVKRRRA